MTTIFLQVQHKCSSEGGQTLKAVNAHGKVIQKWQHGPRKRTQYTHS
jgi:hypothetical protein